MVNLKELIFLNQELNMKKLINTDMTVNNMMRLKEIDETLIKGFSEILKKKILWLKIQQTCDYNFSRLNIINYWLNNVFIL